ncbi:hypothetical protein [Sedimenticola selenatireducens]|uniref:hypothetical protein n=1 Tax=Sedimenticola selenatireducens TaxID=191960 RepID=UPI0004918772|nr:hypothetical protein [Sedimenticola selenatireducens]
MNQAQRRTVLTIDIWDTLLRRECHPDCVKLHVSRYLLTLYGNLLPEEKRDAWTLMRQRQLAEKHIGSEAKNAGLDDEYSLLDVYDRWLDLIGITQITRGSPQRSALIESIASIELEQEQRVTYPDPTIRTTIEEIEVEQRMFLSDFYMPATQLRALLDHHRLSELVPNGWSSCDIGYNKRSGRLFTQVQGELGIQPQQHIHIGDNPNADVFAAKKLGIEAIHFQPQAEHNKRLQHARAFNARQAALEKASADWTNETVQGETPHPAYQYGRQTSLLWIGFILHIMQHAITDKVEQLFFFTREGEFFHRLYQKLAAEDPIGITPPPAQLLEVSRIATFSASLKQASSDELMRLWSQYSIQSPRALFASLDIEPEAFQEALDRLGMDIDTPIQLPWKDPRMQNFLQQPETQQRLNAHLGNKREQLLGYLQTHGIDSDSSRNLGIVDIGWRGSIQDNLAHTLPEITWHGYYLALNRFLNHQPGNSSKNAWATNLNVNNRFAELLDSVAPFEMLCNSPNGSVTGYQRTARGVQAIRLVDQQENRVFEESIRHYQAGVIDSIAFWARLIRIQAYSAQEIRPCALKMWHGIINTPPAFLAHAYFRLNHNETFGAGGFSNKAQSVSTWDILRSPYSTKHRARTRDYLREIGWLPGLYANPGISTSFKLSLRMMVKMLWLRNRLLRR